MAGQCGPNNQKYAYLHQLTIDELLELLTLAPVPAASPEDEAYVDALEEAIIKKEAETPTEFLPDADQQWTQFQEYCSAETEDSPKIPEPETKHTVSSEPIPFPAKPGKRRRLARILIAAAIAACLMTLMIPTALGYDNFFVMIGQWTNEWFRFSPSGDASLVPSADSSGIPLADVEYQSLQEVLDAYGVQERVAPAWIPDGFAARELVIDELDEGQEIGICVLFENEFGAYLVIDYTNYKGSVLKSGIYEKDDTPVQEYITGGITHYVYQNLESTHAVWYNGTTECSFGGDISVDDLQKMIDSIYEEI